MVRGSPIDISKNAISKALFNNDFEPSIKILEYDFWMSELKIVNLLNSEEKLMHYIWFVNHTIEAKERCEWVNGMAIYKHTLSFTSKICLYIVRTHISPIRNDNTISIDKVEIAAAFQAE